MKICKRLALIAGVFASCAGSGENFTQAQWQPVIHLDTCPLYQPVCARSRKRALVTYANMCAARSDQARVVSDGACPENCPTIYKPVCARDTDGKRHSYMNACAAENETAQVIHKGRCVFPARS